MRKLVICMDGTGNEIGDTETNVLKFYRSFAQDEDQKTHYILGVGAYDRQSLMARPFQKLHSVLGLAFGLGLEDDVLEAYRWLCRNYRWEENNAHHWAVHHADKPTPKEFEDDQIYIIGFSRGAYAARVLAGFIHNFGLVDENNLHLIVPAFRAYREINTRDKDEPDNIRFKALRQFGEILNPKVAPIRALGLFDTVSSIISFGWPWRNLVEYQSLFELSTHANVQNNPSVRSVVHAKAIDEHRTFFRSLDWGDERKYFGNRFRNPSSERAQIVQQRWFAGFHSDIGGSPMENETGIGKITALWMLDSLEQADIEADAVENAARKAKKKPLLPGGKKRAHGLRLRKGHREVYFEGKEFGNFKTTNAGGIPYAGPDPRAPIHNSVFESGFIPRWSWFWLILEVLIKSITRREKGTPEWFRRGFIYYLPLLEPRRIPEIDDVDDSVFIRRDDPACDYSPKNMTRPTPDDSKG